MPKDTPPSRNDLLPGTLEMLVLKTLTRGPLHGYPALQRLQLKGWVSSEWCTSPTNRRARFYTLTPEGRKQLGREITHFDRAVEAITRVLRTT